MVKLQLPPPCADEAVTTCEPTVKNDPEAGVIVTVPQVPNASALPYVTCGPGLPPSVVLALPAILFGHSSTELVGVSPVPILRGRATDSSSSGFTVVGSLVTRALLSMVEP